MSAQPKMILCRNCSTPIPKNSNLCPSCGAKNKKPFFRKWWFILLIVVIVIAAIASLSGTGSKKKFVWEDMELGSRLPEPKSNVGTLYHNSEDELDIYVDKTPAEEYKKYVSACQALGYTQESEKTESSYKAFDAEGYCLSLSHLNSSMHIELTAPEQLGTLNWPRSELAALLPQPESSRGKVGWDSADGFQILVGDTSLDAFGAYVDACSARGFTVDYDRGDKYYYADDEKGNHLSLNYKGNRVMSIELIGADEPDTDDSSADSEEAPEESREPVESKEDSAPSESSSSESIRPEFQKAMDSYEDFMKEYCEFMKKFKANSTDAGLLVKYADYLSRYADAMAAFEAWDDGELNAAETVYYLEVQTRVTNMLLEAAQ